MLIEVKIQLNNELNHQLLSLKSLANGRQSKFNLNMALDQVIKLFGCLFWQTSDERRAHLGIAQVETFLVGCTQRIGDQAGSQGSRGADAKSSEAGSGHILKRTLPMGDPPI